VDLKNGRLADPQVPSRYVDNDAQATTRDLERIE
jgi:hypothetical protein